METILVWLGLTGFHRILLGFTGFYLVLYMYSV